MKKSYYLILFLLTALFAQGQRTFQFENIPLPIPAGTGNVWQLQPDFSDDFNYNGKGDSRFTNVWVDRYNPDPRFTGPGATTWVTGNSNVVNGNLELRGTPSGNGRVNSGVVSSRRTIRYPVYMEARIKASNIENSSNFWLLDSGGFQEIDILEVYGGAQDAFFNTQMSTNFHVFRRSGPNGPIQSDNTYQVFFRTRSGSPRWRDSFHTFGCYWRSPNDLTFYIDGQATSNGQHYVSGRERGGLNGSFTQALLQNPITSETSFPINSNLRENQMTSEKFIILDTESHAGRPISPARDLNDRAKNVMLVDWVRVYRPVPSTTNNPTPPTTDTGGAPIGSIISLRKTGGDRKYVSAVAELGNDLYANKASVEGSRQHFRVDAHPRGGVALFSISAQRYVQSNNRRTDVILRATGISPRDWERFEWSSQGNGRVALRSFQTTRWMQAPWNVNNTPLFPRGASPRGWETFEWAVVGSSLKTDISSFTDLDAIQEIGTQLYPNPIQGGSFRIDMGKVENKAEIQIINLQGQIIHTATTNENSMEIDSNLLPSSGIYLVKITMDGTEKIMKIVNK